MRDCWGTHDRSHSANWAEVVLRTFLGVVWCIFALQIENFLPFNKLKSKSPFSPFKPLEDLDLSFYDLFVGSDEGAT